MQVLIDGKIVLHGTVGFDFWDDSGFTALDVVRALATLGRDKPVEVHLNSGGGFVDEGIAIYNVLKAHKGETTCFVDGVAASAASVLAMGCDELVMNTGSVMMIHDPSGFTMGTEEDHQKSIEMLGTLGDALAEIYAEKTGRSVKEMRADMREEIWMTAQEAVDAKLADRVASDNAVEASAFDYRLYAKAPDTMRALASAKGWTMRVPKAASAAQPKETQQMAGETVTKEAAAAQAEASAKIAVDAALARAADINDICAKAGVPAMAAGLIREGTTAEQAKAKVEAEAGRVKAIRDQVKMARNSCPQIEESVADSYIAAGTSADAAGRQLLEKIAAVQAAKPTRSAHQATTGESDAGSVAASWDKAVEKVNARHFGKAA